MFLPSNYKARHKAIMCRGAFLVTHLIVDTNQKKCKLGSRDWSHVQTIGCMPGGHHANILLCMVYARCITHRVDRPLGVDDRLRCRFKSVARILRKVLEWLNMFHWSASGCIINSSCFGFLFFLFVLSRSPEGLFIELQSLLFEDDCIFYNIYHSKVSINYLKIYQEEFIPAMSSYMSFN